MPMRFITIRPSHYVERARWALDLAGLPYEEHSSPPALHLASTIATRPAACKSHSVPMLITPDAGVLTESSAIVAYAAQWSSSNQNLNPKATPAQTLYPEDPVLLKEVQNIEELCERRLGVWTRVIVYHQVLKDNMVFYECLGQGAPAWQRRLFWCLLWPIKAMIVKGLRINAENAEKCRAKVLTLFEEIDEKLRGRQRRYLVGDAFTAADLTFASLAALLVLPDQYGGSTGTVQLGPLRRVFDVELLEQLRGMAAGRHVLEMYRLHRRPATAA